MKKHLFFLPIFSLLLSGCSFDDLKFWEKKSNDSQDSQKEDGKGDGDGGGTTVSVTSIELNKASLNLQEEESEQLSYTISPSNATNKNVTWSTSNSGVASVSNGLVNALREGSATITVTTEDGNKTSSCVVNVSKKPAQTVPVSSVKLNKESLTLEELESEQLSYTIEPSDATNKNVSWSTSNSNVATVNNGLVNAVTEGSATITVTTQDGNKTASCSVTVSKKEEPPTSEFKTISEVKTYIAEHPVDKNSFGNGVNKDVTVTIKAFAIARIDLVKTKSSFGLDVSYPGKVIMADETGAIGVATNVTGDGTTLWGKVGSNVCKPTSKYIVSGYISEYLGHPEIMIKSFSWDQNLDISWTPELLSEETIDLEGFYTRAKNVNYNCAGHGYGDIVTINNLKCYYDESDGAGVDYYNLTDGTNNIRVNAFNLSSITVGSIYNVVGIISLKGLSPIIIAFKISPTENPTPIDFDYESAAASNELTVAQLKTIKGSQDDTSTKYPNVVEAFGKVYKTTGYLCVVEENGKLYIGISDTYYAENQSGKDNTAAQKNVALIGNDDFWNTSESELAKYNPFYTDYIQEETKVTVYYVVRQLTYQSKKAIWKVLLIPDFIDSYKA